MDPRILFMDHVGVLGGGELSLLDIVEHFKNTSRVVLLADGPLRVEMEKRGIEVEVLSASEVIQRVKREGGFLNDLLAIPGLLAGAWKIARQARRFDLIYANSQKSMLVGALAGFLARKPVVWHLRDLMTDEHFSSTHRWISTFFGRWFVTQVISNSKATRDALIDNGVPSDRVVAVYNGFDSRPFEQVNAGEVARIREELGVNGMPVVGVFSRLAPWKGQHVLLEVIAQIPSVHALLVGDALFQEDREYADQLRRQADRLGIADRVHFLGFKRDVLPLMHAVDIVLHTSVSPEPMGRVIVEGMLAHKPVVATKAGGAIELVEDRVTGRLVPPGDPEALRNVLLELFDHPEVMNRLADAGREMAKQKFSLDVMLDRIGQIVQKVTRQHSRDV